MRATQRAMVGLLAVAGTASTALAEVGEVVLGQQFGAVYLPAFGCRRHEQREGELGQAWGPGSHQ